MTWRQMDLAANFEETDIREGTDDDYADFLWEAMEDAAREAGSLFSYCAATDSTGEGEVFEAGSGSPTSKTGSASSHKGTVLLNSTPSSPSVPANLCPGRSLWSGGPAWSRAPFQP